jgi:hypothetical protein
MKRPEINGFVLNEDKNKKSERHPSHKGVLDVDGVLYWVSGWYNNGQYGAYFKGDIRPISDDEINRYFSEGQKPEINKREAAERFAARAVAKPIVVDDDIDDELPF